MHLQDAKTPKNGAPGHLFVCYSLYKPILKVGKRMHKPGAQVSKFMHPAANMCAQGVGCWISQQYKISFEPTPSPSKLLDLSPVGKPLTVVDTMVNVVYVCLGGSGYSFKAISTRAVGFSLKVLSNRSLELVPQPWAQLGAVS